MSGLELTGLILLVGIVITGVVIKHITRGKLRDMDGVSDVFASKKDENIIGKL